MISFPFVCFFIQVWGETCLSEEVDGVEEEEALIEEEAEGLIVEEEADLIEAAEVAAEAALTGSKTTVLQNMSLVRSCKHGPCLIVGFKRTQWLLQLRGKPHQCRVVFLFAVGN